MSNSEVIAAVGMGRMGRGIAITFALAGLPVRLIDLKPRTAQEFAALQAATVRELSATLGMLSGFALLTPEELPSLLAQISFYPLNESAEALRDADIIFEGVPETLEAKKPALAAISEHAGVQAIIASTTSTMLSTELQAEVRHPERFVNAHWLNPAFLVPLVELSPGEQTDPAVTARLKSLLERIGKVPVVCAASPGFIVPRIQALAMNEAARLVEENVASVDDIDKASRYGFGFRFAVLGLLEFIDWGGGDILYHASRYMASATGEARHRSPDIISSNMQQGRLGLGSGSGFLDYQGLDIDAYQREKLGAFIALLRHIGKLPQRSGSHRGSATEHSLQDDAERVRAYLAAMERRDLTAAAAFLSDDFSMVFPGGVTFTRPDQLVNWAKSRYRSVGKTYQRFDTCQTETESLVYCYGTLHGQWPGGSEFSGIRFIDRFALVEGKIVSQQVWNDLAEVSAGAGG